MQFQHIVYKPGKVAHIVFNRPKQLNAQGYQLLGEVDQAFEAAAADDTCGAIVLSGRGRAFSAGHDLGTQEEIEYCRQHGLAEPQSLDFRKKVADMYEYYVQDTMGFTSEIQAAYTSFCLMLGLGGHSSATPEQGGFARTQLARQNLEHSRSWLARQGFCQPDGPGPSAGK